MEEQEFLASRFEANRSHLKAVAYRMLGSLNEAEDAVQEAWLRLGRSDAQAVGNLGGWLTTVVARICLDMLRARKSRREDTLDIEAARTIPDTGTANADDEAALADSVGLALLVVLETLAPAERIAFVLHDMFDLPFDDIAPIVHRSPEAARQLASRARRRVRGGARAADADVGAQRKVVDAFLAASRGGDLAALLAVLDPDVVFRADPAALRLGGPTEMRGAESIARFLAGRAQAARAALLDGAVGVVVAPRGHMFLALNVTITGGRIVAIEAIADPVSLGRLDVAILEE